MKSLFAFIILLVGWTTATTAGGLGPAVGTTIPHMLGVKDQLGNDRGFKDLIGEKGLVIAFVRSADWCPYCKNQLIDLQKEAHAAIQAKGYELVSVSYDPVKKLSDFADLKGIKYPMLSDKSSEIIKAFDVLNEKYEPGDWAYGIPHPVVFITDTEGAIKAKLYEKGYKKRPPTEAILAALD